MEPALSEALLNSILLPIIATDKQGRTLGLNDAARRLLPPDLAEPVGKRLDKLFPEWKTLLTEMRGSHEAFRREVQLDSTRVAEASVTPVSDYGWAVTIYDVSAYKDIEQAKNNLLGEVTHDLKSPLAAILSFADLVRATGELNPKQDQFLGRITSAASRMTEQVHQLLDVVWIEAGMKLALVEVNLLQLVKYTLEIIEPRAAAKHIRFALEAPETVPTITADNNRLGQVIANLVNNAVKYSPENTTITLKIWTGENEVALSVHDQGLGIAAEHLDNLFQRFYRVKSQQTRQIEGTGLGLYIARSIVEQHDGRITVESEPGVGSTFTIYLPLSLQTA